jgi:hypothetical protein
MTICSVFNRVLEYLFTDTESSAVCISAVKQVSIFKASNLMCHHHPKHEAHHANLSSRARVRKPKKFERKKKCLCVT